MPKMTIRLEIDQHNGKRNVVISYESEEDALPIEHEEEHRAMVEKIFGPGVLKAGEIGKIIVERGGNSAPQTTPNEEEQERESIKQQG
jgi:isochorismate hydrolase